MNLSSRTTAYAAFAWVLTFLAWHVVWVATGLRTPSDVHHSGTARVLADLFTVALFVMTVVGTVLPLALAQEWGRRIPRPLLLFAAWTGCVLLGARGLAGVLDDIVRVTGLLPDGLTGLTTEELVGTAHPSAWAVFASGWTDALFVAGGLAFGLAAVTYRPRSRDSHRRGYLPT
ncbi:hypothetical protein [Actinomadura sp. DC4]|uniref:hypothetical protein n=1 Tax=Actinomadura sp. DC4 TaxID=3055069 RepID=UPI0025B21812|nr:hypothetical protein [Actinomadura sp. DC4]MDN3354094.1 hypothetical protein [Actinomadura sp. DC4]